MPFTFSHPAIILPLSRLPKHWISLTGLIIGSMTPDFEYFIRLSVKSYYSHTWSGLFWFDLPFGLLLFFVYQMLVKDKLIDRFPTILNTRFSSYKSVVKNDYSLKYLIVVALSLLVGAFSHIFWDGFTHSNGYFVILMPWLSETIQLGKHYFPIYKVIQHGSTLIGAVVIAIVIYDLPLGVCTRNRRIIGFWIPIILCSFIVLIIRLKTGLSLYQYGDILVSMIAGGWLGLLTSSIFANGPNMKTKAY